MYPPLYKHGVCMITFPLDILIPSVSFHHGSVLIILLNWLLLPFSNIQVPLVGTFSVGVKPARMIYAGVGTALALQRGVEPTCWIPYGLFSHNHLHGRGFSVDILGSSQGGERWTFPFHPGECIFWSLNFSTWCHEFHWCLLPCIFISRFCRS